MQHRPYRGLRRALALAGLGAGAWLAFAGSAQGGPSDDGVFPGTIAFFSGGACPAGWTPATTVQGRLVVGVADGSRGGVMVGTPLGDQEDRQHQHAYTGSVQIASQNIAGADGSNDNGAAAQTYTVAGTTAMASTSLPFVQVQPCLKQ
jgi:hypothetical protein